MRNRVVDPTIVHGLDAFSRLTVSQADANRFRAHDHPAIWLAGQPLDVDQGRMTPTVTMWACSATPVPWFY